MPSSDVLSLYWGKEYAPKWERAKAQDLPGGWRGREVLLGSCPLALLCSPDPHTRVLPPVSVLISVPFLFSVPTQVVLPCQSTTKESVTDLNFFWYRKFPGETLTFLLQAHETAKNDKYHKDQFSMTVYKNKTAPLEIAEVSLEDTAIYYCVLNAAGASCPKP
uniref:Ig-like domain-containing protein n=1 Tax=Cyanoderma ruficeps TaxID=181631 RepID=A0A8C3QH92_9PASS